MLGRVANNFVSICQGLSPPPPPALRKMFCGSPCTEAELFSRKQLRRPTKQVPVISSIFQPWLLRLWNRELNSCSEPLSDNTLTNQMTDANLELKEQQLRPKCSPHYLVQLLAKYLLSHCARAHKLAQEFKTPFTPLCENSKYCCGEIIRRNNYHATVI